MIRSITKNLLLTMAGLFFLFSAFAETSYTNTNKSSVQKDNNNTNINNLESNLGLRAHSLNEVNNNNSYNQSNNSVSFDPSVNLSAKQANLDAHVFKGNPSKVPPANDDICNAIELTVGAAAIIGDNSEATTEVGEPTAACWFDAQLDSSVWYYFVASGAGTYTVTTDLNVLVNDDTQLGLYTSSGGCTGALTEVACNDDVSGTNFLSTVDYLSFTPDTIWVQVDGWSGTSGTFELQVTFVAAPANGDAAIVAGPSPSGIGGGYVTVPLSQANGNNIDFSTLVSNLGTSPLTGVTVNGTVNPGNISVSGSTALLSAGASSVITTGSFAANVATAYTADINITSVEPDADTTNNSASIAFTTANVSDSVYALENSIGGGPANSIGAVTTARLGNVFSVNNTDTVTSITVFLGGDPVGQTFEVFIGDPNGTSDIYSGTISGLSGSGFYTFDVGAVILTPGNYIFGLNQIQSGVNIGLFVETTSQIPGVSLFGNYGSWTDLTSLAVPAAIRGNVVVRPNFGTFVAPPAGGDAAFVGAPLGSGIGGFYASVPLSQANGNNVDFSALISNSGIDSLTGVTVTGTINPGNFIVTGSIPLLSVGAVNSITTSSFAASPTTAYTADFDLTSNEPDIDTSDNSASIAFTTSNVSDSVYALENSIGGGPANSIGAVTTARLGNVFSVNTTDTVTSITVFLGGDPVGQTFEVFIGDPNGTSDIYSGTISGLSGSGFYTFDVGGVILTPGNYIFGLNQIQSGVNIGLFVETTSQIPGVSLFGNYGGWTDLTSQAVPAAIRGNIVVRPNFGTAVATSLSAFTLTAPADGTVLDVMGAGTQTVNITWNASTPTPAATVNYEWLLDLQGGNFSNPLASISAGTATNLLLTYADIDNLLASLSVPIGDTVQTSWTVRASAPGAQLLATAPFDLDLIRSGLVSNTSRDFEAYNAGDLIVANDAEWEFWPFATLDAPVSVAQSQSGTNSLLIDGAPTQDLVFKLGDQTSGTWGVGFSMYIETGNGAYYNLQETEVPGVRWPIGNVEFDPGGTGTVTNNAGATIGTFNFPSDQWFDVRNYVDLDNDSVQVWIDNALVYSAAWTALNPGVGQLQLGGINIYPQGDAGNDPLLQVFYLDDMYFQPDSLRTPVTYSFTPFNLTSPPDLTRLEVEAGDQTPITITWGATTVTPNATPNYRWLVDGAGNLFNPPLIDLPSDNGGVDAQLTLTSDQLDSEVANVTGIFPGDSVDLDWKVVAEVFGQSAEAANGPFSIRVVRRIPVGLESSDFANRVKFYPNPTRGELVVEVKDNLVQSIMIQSMIGQNLKSFEINSTTNVFDLSDLGSGMYIIRFVSENQEYSQKLIIE